MYRLPGLRLIGFFLVRVWLDLSINYLHGLLERFSKNRDIECVAEVLELEIVELEPKPGFVP